MNLVLFEPGELDRPLRTDDPRAVHIVTVLRRGLGESFDIGVIGGPRGKGWIVGVDGGALTLGYRFEPGVPPGSPAPVSLIVGLARPQTMRRILRDATTLGAGELLFAATERGEASYGASSLWSSGEYRRHLVDGAAQAFVTHLPAVRWFDSLGDCLAAIERGTIKLALDNYEAALPLASWRPPPRREPPPEARLGEVASPPGHPGTGGAAVPAIDAPADAAASGPRAQAPSPAPDADSFAAAPLPTAAPRVYLAVGSERGWTERERDLLRADDFLLVHLGTRVLRAEVACVAGLTLVLAALGLLQ